MIFEHPYSNTRESLWENANFDAVRPIKRRKIGSNVRVRFNDKVVVHEDDGNKEGTNGSNKNSLSTCTWLTPNDFTKIKNNMYTTLEFIKVQGNSFGFDTPLSSRYCSRGLENYDTEQKCTKFSTVQRRTEAIQAVLMEQEYQRRQLAYQLQEGILPYSREFDNYYDSRPMGMSASVNMELQQFNFQRQQYMQRLQGQMPRKDMLDNSKIRDMYMNLTYQNVQDAIDMGRKDSEDALMIYRSEPLPLTTK